VVMIHAVTIKMQYSFILFNSAISIHAVMIFSEMFMINAMIMIHVDGGLD
jgi:hypothetical protein